MLAGTGLAGLPKENVDGAGVPAGVVEPEACPKPANKPVAGFGVAGGALAGAWPKENGDEVDG